MADPAANGMVRGALADHGWTDGVLLVVLGGLVAAPLVVPPLLQGRVWWEPVHIAIAGGILAAIVVLLVVVFRARVASERRWLAQLPFPFVVDAYLTALTKENAWTTVTVELELATAIDSDAFEARLQAIPWVRSTSSWKDGTHFRFLSKPLTTKSYSKNGSSYGNGAVHRWFRRCTIELLVPLHAEHPLRSVSVRT